MMSRTQLLIETHLLRAARKRAADAGVSLAEYVRRLLARDLEQPMAAAAPSLVFNLGDSGGADIARRKDAMIAEAITADHGSRRSRR